MTILVQPPATVAALSDSSGPPIEDAVRAMLRFIGENPGREGLLETPTRVARALKEMTRGYEQVPEEILSPLFAADNYDQMVLLDDIEFNSLCEHHLLPFSGRATVAYLPGNQVVGLSKLARLVHCFARRLQMQERMTREIAEALYTHINARGSGVILRAQHSCMSCRGVEASGTQMVTTQLFGEMKTDPGIRNNFLTYANPR